MHCATCFSVMRDDANIMEMLDSGSKSTMRKDIVKYILATDLKEHHSSLAKLKAALEDETFLQAPGFDGEGQAKFDLDMQMAGETIIKASDIGQGMVPWEMHKEWS